MSYGTVTAFRVLLELALLVQGGVFDSTPSGRVGNPCCMCLKFLGDPMSNTLPAEKLQRETMIVV